MSHTNMIVFQYIMMLVTLGALLGALFLQWRSHKSRKSEVSRILKERQQALRDAEQARQILQDEQKKQTLLRLIVNTSRDAILTFTVDHDGTPSFFTDINQTACTLLEYEEEKLKSLTPMDVELIRQPEMQRPQSDVDLLNLNNSEHLPRDNSFARRAMQRLIKNAISEGSHRYESNIVTRTGKRVPVEISIVSAPSGNHSDHPIIYMLHDISDRLHQETCTRHCEDRFKDFFQSTLVGAAMYDAQHHLVNVNPACLRIFGSPHMEEFRKFNLFSATDIPPAIHERLKQGENANCEVVFDIDTMISKQQFVSNRRGKIIVEIFFQNLGFDSEHHPLGHLVQMRELTELRELEEALQQRESQLRQAQKMEAIGTMTGGIAHDFNNILTPILGYSEIGLEVCDKESPLHEFIREIRVSTLRAKDLVNQILLFSRQTDKADTQIHLAPIIKEVAKQQAAALPENIKVNYAIRTEHDFVQANPTQIHQILTNFATNAAYAMKTTGGQLDIQLSQFNMGWRHRQEFPRLKKGTYIRITVRDNGEGIPPDVIENVFTPFFSTKPSGEGTGMGLAVVKGIVDALNGDIAIESQVGEGTALHVALPLVDTPVTEEDTDWSPPAAEGERILFVDDEHTIARMAPALLKSLGYRTDVFTSGGKALEAFTKQPQAYDLLITDQVMPKMTGAELAAALREIRPDLPIIICSGYSEQFNQENAEAMQINAFLQKPITRRELGEVIQQTLHPNR